MKSYPKIPKTGSRMRYNFAVNSLDEYNRVYCRRYIAGWLLRFDVVELMQRNMTPDEKRDWFLMYNMGGEPYAHRESAYV